MQEISSDSKNILILAFMGAFLPGMLLAYRLNLFAYFSAINDEKKIVLPSLLFLLCPFLVPFMVSHPLPSALSSIIPVTTFILGQLFAESNNQKLWSEKEKEAIHQLYKKLLNNYKKAKDNESHLKSYLKKEFCPTRSDDLSALEDIRVELINLESFQVLIQSNLRLASNELINCTRDCARLINEFNIELTHRKNIENEIEDMTPDNTYDNTVLRIEQLLKIREIDDRLLRLLNHTKGFLSYEDEFSKAGLKIKIF
jgi:hypothetical protein